MSAPVQIAHNYPGTDGTVSTPFTNPNQVGNLLICVTSGLNTTFGSMYDTVSDSQGNPNWTNALGSAGAVLVVKDTVEIGIEYPSYYSGQGWWTWLSIWYCWNCKAGANTVILDANGEDDQDPAMTLYEYSLHDIDMTAGDPLLSVTSQNGVSVGSDTTVDTVSGITVAVPAMLFAAWASESNEVSTQTAVSPFTLRQVDTGHCDAQMDAFGIAPGTYSASINNPINNMDWVMAVLAFKAVIKATPFALLLNL